MSIPKKPGKSFVQMMDLVIQGHIPRIFNHELLIAIFWEETFFNNVRQGGGTGVGFGQAEPSEFYKFKTDFARQHGYYMPDLPPTRKIGERTELMGTLTDIQAVKVASAALHHNYYSRKQDKRDALFIYAGVYYKGKTSLTKGDRIRIVNNWLASESHFMSKMGLLERWFDDFVIEGLKKAKSFNKELEPEFRAILFSKLEVPGWLREYMNTLTSSPSYLKQGSIGHEVRALQTVLNFKKDPTTIPLVEDGLFGQKTLARVIDFQQGMSLVSDGIVGPKTKAALIS